MRLFHSSSTELRRTGGQDRRATRPARGRLCCGWFLLGLACVSVAAVADDDASNPPAIIQLLSHAECTGGRVRLADVADISTAAPDLYNRLSQIDLAEIDEQGSLQRIPRDQIELRLRLAGFQTKQIELVGARSVVVRGPRPFELTDAAIETAATEAIATLSGIALDDLRVSLTAPMAERWKVSEPLTAETRLEVVPLGNNRLGRVSCTCRLLQGSRLLGAQLGVFNVSRRQEVIVATASLSRGQNLTRNMIREEVRFVTGPVDELTREIIEGKTLKLSLIPGEVVTLRHIATDGADDGQVVIRPRDAVRVTAHKGRLEVVIRDAEALQAGREGQLIRVRNVQSNRIITGRVSGPGEVEIELP